MIRLHRSLAPLALSLLVAGCASANMRQLDQISVADDDIFTRTAVEGYTELAHFEADQMQDFKDAKLFAEKALKLAAEKAVYPQPVESRKIAPEYQEDLRLGYLRLIDALNSGAPDDFPKQSATALFKYDCWLEQQEENIQPDHIADCRVPFESAIDEIEQGYARKIKANMAKIRAKHMAEMEALRNSLTLPPLPPIDVMIFFDRNQDSISFMNMHKISLIAELLRDDPRQIARIEGHTDRKGSKDYNQSLSARRAQAVYASLVEIGVPVEQVEIIGLGESDPLFPTRDGKLKAENRRVKVIIQ